MTNYQAKREAWYAARHTAHSALSAPVLDIFAGHGWGTACQVLGIDEIGIEIDRRACETRRNAGMRTVQGDTRDFDPREWAGVEGLIASPPCQDFSVGGLRKGLDGERGKLVFEAMRYAEAIRPRWILFEQVPQVFDIFVSFAERLRELGYHTRVDIVRCETLGIPTVRKRVILSAHRDRPVRALDQTHSRFYPRNPQRMDAGMFPCVSMREALDLPVGGTIGTRRSPDSRSRRAADYRSTDYPSVAITRFASSWEVREPGEQRGRLIQVPELALLQSYPASFPFAGPRRDQILQVANSVPPALAEQLIQNLL